MSDLVEFRHLKYIVAVAEAANITRAAERLFLAQPSLSKQIKDFEDEIGFPIFVRTREGVRITPPGQMIIAYAQEALLARTKIIRLLVPFTEEKCLPSDSGFHPSSTQSCFNAFATIMQVYFRIARFICRVAIHRIYFTDLKKERSMEHCFQCQLTGRPG